MQYLKLFKESNSSIDPKEMVDKILSYANEFRDEYSRVFNIKEILGLCCELTEEESQDMDKETMLRCLRKLLEMKNQHWWVKQYRDFMEVYEDIVDDIEGHLSMDEIKDLFEDVSTDYDVSIFKTQDIPVNRNFCKSFRVEINNVSNSEIPQLISRYYVTVASRLPKSWVISSINISNLPKLDYKTSTLFVNCSKIDSSKAVLNLPN
jgi:hypothetical protein